MKFRKIVIAGLCAGMCAMSTPSVSAYERLIGLTVETDNDKGTCRFVSDKSQAPAANQRIIAEAKKVIDEIVATGTLSLKDVQENAETPGGSEKVVDWAAEHLPQTNAIDMAKSLRTIYKYSTGEVKELEFIINYLESNFLGMKESVHTKDEAKQIQIQLQLAINQLDTLYGGIPKTSPGYGMIRYIREMQEEVYGGMLKTVTDCVEGRSTPAPKPNDPAPQPNDPAPKPNDPSSSTGGIVAGVIAAIAAIAAAVIAFIPQVLQLFGLAKTR